MDPWEFQRWAYGTKVGSPARKSVLMVLATMADANTGRCEPKQATLAEACEMGERTVRGHLKAMEDAGVIARRHQQRVDGSRRSDEFLMLAPWIKEWPDGSPIQTAESAARPTGSAAPIHAAAGDQSMRHGVAAQERPEGTTRRTSKEERAREKAQTLPDDFPEELKPHARRVFSLLRDVADQHNAREVTPRGVGLAIMGHPGRRFVGVAYELASWAQSGRHVEDAVGTYRTFLKRADVFAGVEPLNGPTPTRQNGNGRRGGIQSGDFLAVLAERGEA